MARPLHLRELRAAMALKDLDLRSVARKAGVPYTTASELLSGRRVSPQQLASLSKVIERAPMPREVVA